MDITPLLPKNANIIQSYGKDFFKIRDEYYYNNILISIDQLIEIKSNNIIEELDVNKDIMIEKELCIIGTGKKFISSSNNIKTIFDIKEKYNINVEFMDSGAACRTYNILASEGRKIVALILKNNNN